MRKRLFTGIPFIVLGFFIAIVVFPFSGYIGYRLNLPYLFPSPASFLLALFSSLALSFIIGPLASLRSALKISKAETWYTMCEGE